MNVTGDVTLHIDQHIATLSFCHPKSNCLTKEMLRRLSESIQSLYSRGDIACIVLDSKEGKIFCSGASFDELLELGHISASDETTALEQATEFFSGFARVIAALYQAPQLTLALVNGKTIGGGVGLVAACDYALASSDAAIRLSELSIGIGPFVISEPVIRKLGLAQFSALSIDTEWRTAEWGLAHGLFSKVAAPSEDFQGQAATFVSDLAKKSPSALYELKRLLHRASPAPSLESMLSNAAITARLALSRECQKALAGFKK
jgi:methylglutaconyl-CoA hydratase